MEMTQDKWATILSTILSHETERTGLPVPGAKLRALLSRRAAEENLTIPRDQPFVAFLQSFEQTVEIVRQPGSDILVLPRSKPELLTDVPEYHIRRDLFEAFTTIGSGSATPWYDREHDRVFWRKADAAPMAAAVSIPSNTLESEIQARRKFVALLGDDPVVKELLQSLEEALPLKAFSRAADRHGVIRRWYAYKSQEVRSRLEAWASANKLDWKDAWLTPRRDTPSSSPGLTPSRGNPDEWAALLEAITQLDRDEIRRIQVPLDIVAKLYRQR